MTINRKKLKAGSLRDIEDFLVKNRDKLSPSDLDWLLQLKEDVTVSIRGIAEAITGFTWTPMVPAFHMMQASVTKTKVSSVYDCFCADDETFALFQQYLKRVLDYYSKVKAKKKQKA